MARVAGRSSLAWHAPGYADRGPIAFMSTLVPSTVAADPQEQIIAALRGELEEYGGLLNVFDEQQQAILNRQPDAVLALEEKLSAQLSAVRTRRTQREGLLSRFAGDGRPPSRVSVLGAIPAFRESLRPLVEALASEINRLIALTRRRAEQNQMLLARTVEVMQEVCERLQPGAVTRTYAANGQMKIKAPAGAGRLLEHS
jgi:flagellar biosynthesis/type III secretory pathway chaperone